MRPARARVCFLVLGSRGDVQPLALLAAHLQATRPLCVTLVTHTAHAPWLHALLPALRLAACLPHSPGAVWHGEAAAAATDAPVAREALITACCGALGLSPPAGPHRRGGDRSAASRGEHTSAHTSSDGAGCGPPADRLAAPEGAGTLNQQRLLVFNLFALEGYHLAEALAIPCAAAHPYPIPYPCPASFERRIAAAHPALHAALGADCGGSSPGGGSVGWTEVGRPAGLRTPEAARVTVAAPGTRAHGSPRPA